MAKSAPLLDVPEEISVEGLATGVPPAQQQDRRPMYLGESVEVTIASEAGKIDAVVTEISCFGFAARPTSGGLDAGDYLSPGGTVKVVLSYRERSLTTFPAVVKSVTPLTLPGEPPIPSVSVEFVWDKAQINPVANVRKWYTCSDLFPVVAYCDDPFFFQEKSYFRVQKISRKGLWVSASARNKSLIPNLCLAISLQLPSLQPTTIAARVVYVENSERPNRINLILHFLDISDENISLLGEYLLLSGAAKTEELTKENFLIQRIRAPMDFRYATDPAEIERILRMRCAFHKKTAIPAVFSKDEMEQYTDGFDRNARQVFFVVASEPVAAVRVFFPGKELSRSELHEVSINFPLWLRHNQFVEASRLVWALHFKEKDFLLFVIRHLVRIAIETGHQYLVVHIPLTLSQVFKTLGFESVPVEYRQKPPRSSHADPQEVVILDVKGAMNRMPTISEKNWAIFYAPLLK